MGKKGGGKHKLGVTESDLFGHCSGIVPPVFLDSFLLYRIISNILCIILNNLVH